MMRRINLAAVTLALVLAPTPALADEPQETAVANIPLVAAGIAVLLLGAALLAFRRFRRWIGWSAVALGVVIGAAGFVVPQLGGTGTTDATVSVVRPEPGEEVPAGEPVTVEVEVHGGDIARSPTDPDGGHLHLYVDGELQQMPYSTTAEIELEPGAHMLRVEYVDHEHVSFDPEVDTEVPVVAR